VSRSAAVAIYYLMKCMDWDYQTSSTFLVSKRPVAIPNPGYVQQLRFVGSMLYKLCNQMSPVDQYKYWLHNSESSDVRLASEKEELLSKQLQQERADHAQTKDALAEVTENAEEGKQTLKELVQQVTQYMTASNSSVDELAVCIYFIVLTVTRNTNI
jgi:hypothetical protein